MCMWTSARDPFEVLVRAVDKLDAKERTAIHHALHQVLTTVAASGASHVRHRGARSLPENRRREDPRPLAGSRRRAIGIEGPRGSRLLDCSTSLHWGGRSPGKHRSSRPRRRKIGRFLTSEDAIDIVGPASGLRRLHELGGRILFPDAPCRNRPSPSYRRAVPTAVLARGIVAGGQSPRLEWRASQSDFDARHETGAVCGFRRLLAETCYWKWEGPAEIEGRAGPPYYGGTPSATQPV